ncbi:helix-turn-helix domain-containing protein [Nonlabens ulvanivorans]|uniref:helix-turn-helix domain-containing protein n=1 Tax=Nonlabens ulvanivorans TaxID=906888 RepID=UPI0037C664D9
MISLNLSSLVAVVTIFLAVLLSFFLVSVKTQNKLSNRLFALFLIWTAIDISVVVIDSLLTEVGNIQMLRPLFIFLQLPTFYLYVKSACYSDFKLKWIHMLHIIPFLLVNAILVPRYYAVDLPGKVEFLSNIQSMWEIQFNFIFIHIQIAVYLVLAFLTIKKAKRLYLENYAGESIETFVWLFQFTVALSIFYAIALLKNIFKFSEYQEWSESLTVGLFVFELFIISWYLLKALTHPNLFRSLDSRLQLVEHIISEDEQEEDSDTNEISEELIALKKYMEEEQPYLNPALTIQDISDTSEIPVRELSLLINHQLNQHFYDFVNSYRIEHAKKLLKDSSKVKWTVLEILYESGFNSKSSFNTAFKKHTGTTPTSYRKSL